MEVMAPVAGVVLYSKNFSEAPTNFIRNLRILDQSNNLENNFPAELIKKIIEENLDCRIFNLSINSEGPCRTKHISSWAAQLDLLSNEYNSIFVISIGNLSTEFINNYISGNVSYPEYLNENVCRIANPSQSMFAISVGSYNTVKFEDEDFLSIEDTEQISSFSRSGLGMWGSIKPTVVESGGGLQQSKSFPFHVHRKAETSITTLKSSLNSPGLISKNEIGTSFAAGFVSNLVGKIANLYKDEHSNIIKALLVQSARLPLNHFYNPSLISIKHFGYGIPSESRALNNSPHRITFYNSGKISAYQGHIYEVRIPDNLVNQGDEFEVLLEFTLCYTAIVRRTRQKVKSYLSTWLDWDSSKLGESFSEFRLYTMNEIDLVAQDDYNKEQRKSLRGVPWMIQNRINSGINGLIRSDNAIQKDWAIIKAFDLPDAISFAIKAHKGWDNKLLPIEYAITFSIEILGQEIPIYNEIAIENDLEVEI